MYTLQQIACVCPSAWKQQIHSSCIYVISYCNLLIFLCALRDPHLFQYMQRTCDVVTALVHELPHIKPTEEMVSHLRYTHFGAEETHARW